MLVPELDHSSIIRNNADEHAAMADTMKWLGSGDAVLAEAVRRSLLDAVGSEASLAFRGTKPVFRRLSPGCRLCGEGEWSCLFINNLCNARCFFCPTDQDNQDEPGTSTLTFPEPGEYADYLERFGFKGASISGGEPLLSFEKTLSFITAVKERLGGGIYLWMYTNGRLLTVDKARLLAHAGLDEIRFNIIATGYDLTPLRMAAGAIPAVTVEIPAVPEDIGIMKVKLRELADTGVSFLNLHQIRCTGHNRERLAGRGYTFLHGPQIGILESELTALELMNHAREQGVDLGINYCSLIYRHRFQSRSSRRRWARLMAKPFEGVTDAGLIRTLRMDADPESISGIEAVLRSRGVDPGRWSTGMNSDRITLDAGILGMIDRKPPALKVSYSLATVRPGLTYRNPFKEVSLASGRKIVLERGTVFPDMELGPDEIEMFCGAFIGDDTPSDPETVYRKALSIDTSGPMKEKWQRIIQAEALRHGLLEYY
jgi:pyruvate formate-lyase activating enzyme-like uncharacterized protein